MRSWSTSQRIGLLGLIAIIATLVLATPAVWAQSSQYQRKAPPKKAAKKGGGKEAPKEQKGEKLDISDLEQKYWAPKDTDFSVVQNRTYTKAKKYAANLMFGPLVNETFSKGNSLGLGVNYYFSERHGVEFNYVTADTGDSKTTKVFREKLSGGGVGPDYNRPTGYYGISYNWVPFYAKMSVLGQKIIYFDMQFSPGIAFSTYDQVIDDDGDNVKDPRTKSKSAVGLSLDVTQYFFFSRSLAVRVDLRNRWYKQEVLKYTDGTKARDETTNVTTFLLGVSYFF